MKIIKANVKLPIEKVDEIIKSTGKRIAYCKFRKKNGSVRQIWYQTISSKQLRGGKPTYDAFSKGQTRVKDIKIKSNPNGDSGIRCITWQNVIEIGIAKEKYYFGE